MKSGVEKNNKKIAESENSEEVKSPESGGEEAVPDGQDLEKTDSQETDRIEEDWEEEDNLQDDWEEDASSAKPWMMALVFLGLVIVAAVICVVLWNATHTDEPDDNLKNALVETTENPADEDMAGSLGQAGTAAPESGQPDEAQVSNRVTTQDGRVVEFTDCDDMVTPKEYVNLRTEPSTSQMDASVSCRLNKGETAHRTGISEEMGWSRVEYNGQILYVITSYISVVEDTQTAE